MHKRMFCLAVSSLLSIGAALALPQDAPPPPPSSQDQGAPPPDGGGRGPRQAPDPDRIVQMMAQRLKLSDDQVSRIRPIVADQMSQMMAIRGDSSVAPRDRMAKMMSLRAETSAKIKPILNPDQRTQYEAMQQEQMNRMRQRTQGGPNGAGAPPEGSNQ